MADHTKAEIEKAYQSESHFALSTGRVSREALSYSNDKISVAAAAALWKKSKNTHTQISFSTLTISIPD